MKRKIMALLLTLTLIASLAGCGSDTVKAEPQEPVSAEETLNEDNTGSSKIDENATVEEPTAEKTLSLEEMVLEYLDARYTSLIGQAPLDSSEFVYNYEAISEFGIDVNGDSETLMGNLYKSNIVDVDFLITSTETYELNGVVYYHFKVNEKYIDKDGIDTNSTVDYFFTIEADIVKLVYGGYTGDYLDALSIPHLYNASISLDSFILYERVDGSTVFLDSTNNSEFDLSVGWTSGFNVFVEYMDGESEVFHQDDKLSVPQGGNLKFSNNYSFALDEFASNVKYVYLTDVYILTDTGLPTPGEAPTTLILYFNGDDNDEYDAKFEELNN